MTQNTRPIGEEDLHAYVDGYLDPERRFTVERYLQAYPEAAARIRGWQETSDALRRALAVHAEEPVPAALRPANLLAARRRWAPVRMVAGVALTLMVGAGAGWLARGETAPAGLGSIEREAALTHRVLTADRGTPMEFPAGHEAEMVSWTSRHLGYGLPPPDLTQSGFRLLGGRVVVTDKGLGCLYAYGGADGNHLTLFVRQMQARNDTATMRPIDVDGINGYAWARAGMGFSLISSRPMSDLHEISNKVRDVLGEQL